MPRFSKLLEPEEAVGSLWHRWASAPPLMPRFPSAAVALDDRLHSLGVVFRGLGGEPGVQIKATAAGASGHRLAWRQRLGTDAERLSRARFDGDTLFLPPIVDNFPDSRLNDDLYTWLAAWAASATDMPLSAPLDPLLTDTAFLRWSRNTTASTLERFPGLGATYRRLADAHCALRPARDLPFVEAMVETCIVALLRDASPPPEAGDVWAAITNESRRLDGFTAPPGYRPHLPVPMWGEASVPELRRAGGREDDPDADSSGQSCEEEGPARRGRRDDGPDINRKDGLILNRFEKILSWTEFLRLNRGIDDEDADQARKAADDHDDITIVKTRRRAATRLRLDLDLSPEEAERDRLDGAHIYPEWDFRRQRYLEDHCRVLTSVAGSPTEPLNWEPDAAARRRIRAVRRQFEALRPRRVRAHRQLDGGELDMDALIRSRSDLIARGEGADTIYVQSRREARDLAVSVLIDVSRSTETYVDNRPVLDVAKEALSALTQGLTACDDDHAIYAFSSCKRQRVWVRTVKAFTEASESTILGRIAALKPGHYTRLGAAVRHVSAELMKRPRQHRLLLVLTDGKPNDLDQYEGRYGIEDCSRAIREARRSGHAVFGITIDAKARAYFPRIFGQNAFAIITHTGKLTEALPQLYRHIVQ